MGSAQVDSLGPLCVACNYPLRGLSEDRCPECGRAFDPRDAMTMNVGRSLSGWHRFWLRPPGRVFHALVVLGALVTLAAGSAPGAYLVLILVLLPLWFALGTWWGMRVLAFFATSFFRRQPLRWHHYRWVWWVTAPLIVIMTVGALRLNIPMRATFRLSRPALERVAQDALAGKAVAGHSWIGLYPIQKIKVDGDRVHFYLEHTAFFDTYALTYSPDFAPVAHDGDLSHRHLRGPWYVRCERF